MRKTLPELYLEKRDELSEREREAILKAIEWMNEPHMNITGDINDYFLNDQGFIIRDTPAENLLDDNK